MSSRLMDRVLSRAALAIVLALGAASLFGCSGEAPTAGEAGSSSAAEEPPWTSGDNIGSGKIVVSPDEATKIFSATVDGRTYAFPGDVEGVLADGWEYGKRNGMPEDRVLEPGEGIDGLYLTKGAVDQYGWADSQVSICFANWMDEPSSWREATLLGVSFRADEDELAAMEGGAVAGGVEFSSGIGINVGDPCSLVEDMFGEWNSYGGDASPQSSTFEICVEGEGGVETAGYATFGRIGDVVNEVNVRMVYERPSFLSQ